MGNNYSPAKLGDVASVTSGFAFKSKDMGEVGDPIIKIKNIIPPIVDLSDVKRVPSTIIESNNRISRFRLSAGDILIAMTGATVGKVGRVPAHAEPFYLNQRVGKVFLDAPEKANYDYLYYVLSQESLVKEMFGVADGSAQANISGKQIEGLRIPLPGIDTQRAIAHILGSLDDKIELNRHMNRTLEKMAQAIFKSWFIDFDPVRAKAEGRDTGLPKEIADLFPDSFENSELGEIPKGWEVGDLQDLLVLQRGFDLPKKKRSIGKHALIAASGQDGYHNEYKVSGPGVTTGRSGKLGIVTFVHSDFWPLNTTLWIKAYKKSNPYHAYFLLRTLKFETYNAGSAVPTLNRNHIHNLKLPVPSEGVLKCFALHSQELFSAISQNIEQVNRLSRLRDTLLPKLISGELPIPDAEKFIEEAGV